MVVLIISKMNEDFRIICDGVDLKDLCPTCIHFLNYKAEISFDDYVRTTKCSERGKFKGVLSECKDYKSMGLSVDE